MPEVVSVGTEIVSDVICRYFRVSTSARRGAARGCAVLRGAARGGAGWGGTLMGRVPPRGRTPDARPAPVQCRQERYACKGVVRVHSWAAHRTPACVLQRFSHTRWPPAPQDASCHSSDSAFLADCELW